jgi:hypothetical protein
MLTLNQIIKVARMLEQTGRREDKELPTDSMGGSCREIADGCSKGVPVCIEYVIDAQTGDLRLVNTAELPSNKNSDE